MRTWGSWLSCLLLPLLAACGASSSTSMVGPTGARCAVSVQASAATIAAGGGTGAITVDTARECQWTATAEVPWLTLMSSTSGQGSGSLPFSAAPNRTTATRVGAIAVNGQRVEIAQEAGTCDISVAPAALSTGAAGGELHVAVTAQEFCAWTAVSRVSWIVIASSGNGTGTSDVTITATANTGPARTGTIDIGGRSVVVSQEAAPQGCTYAIGSSTLSASAAGESVSVAVTATANCPWAAISEDAWIAVRAGAAGSGNGSVTLEVLSNSGPARTGRVTIAGRTFTVTQGAGTGPLPLCTYAVSPGSVAAPATGGTSPLTVTAGAGCSWTLAGAPSWITVSGGTGSGNGTINLTVSANTGAARTATLTLGGQSITVTQAAAGTTCTYALNPTSLSATAAGGPSTVAVTTAAGCTWTTTGAPAWITVTGGSGTGNGSVTLAVAANTGSARTATLTIAGLSFAVTQAAAGTTCTYGINPTSASPSAAGGSTTVAVTTTSGCTWTTSGAPAWITVTGGSGSGNGSVTVAVAANTGATRTATLTIAGHSFTVTQAAACTYSISPTSFSPTVAGSSTTIAVTATAGCAWTTNGAPSWITVTGGSGTGIGSVTVAAAANTGAARTATFTIAGQSFTVTQAAAPCSFTVTPITIQVSDANTTKKVNVSTANHCSWTASVTSGSSWLSVSPSSDTGNGTVDVSIARNQEAARTGTLLIAGTVVTVSQDAK
jgi:all-beta uncharacterized protein/BACON domain-containing protein